MTASDPPAAAARRPRLLVPIAVLSVSLLMTFAAAAYVAYTAAMRDRLRFNNACERTQAAIKQRIDTYVNLLRGGAALFALDRWVTREQFHTYVDRLDLARQYPGIQGVGVSARIPPGGMDGLLERMQKEWKGQFHIFPQTPPRDEYHTIVYLEPEDRRNLAAVGYDMFTEPTRRAAMELARDSGAAATSGKVTLKQEIDDANRQAGFLIYVPIYFGPYLPTTQPARRLALAGFVYAPFRGDDLLEGIFGSSRASGGVHFTVYDGEQASDDAILHRSGPPDPSAAAPRFARTRRLEIPGRNWTIAYHSGPAFESNSLRELPLLVLGAGGVVSCLLFALTAAQANAHRRTEAAAEELRNSTKALRASESRFRRLVDSNLVGVVFSTLDGRVTDGNDEYFRIVGRRRDDVMAGDVRWDTMTPPQYADADRRAVAELKSTGVSTPFEKEFLRPDGTRVPALVGVAMLEGSDNETVALYVDLTARKEAERTAVRAKEVAEAAQKQAEEASRLKDDFLATVSHELRTPLNAILGWAELLRAGREDPQDFAHGLETIERAAKAQAQLIDDLLDVSRIVAGKLRLEVKVVQLTAVIETALASIRPAADAKGVQLTHILDPDASLVHGDVDRLGQIVWNLLSNAVKFTPRGGMMQVVLRRDEAHAQVIVSDTGIGIRPEFVPHVFERFRQADASTTRRFGGLGLGLGIVRHLTELHGGTVRADSEGEGKGATFTLTLPLAIAHTHAGAQRSAAPDRSNASPPAAPVSLTGVRVLLAEDDPVARDLIARILRDRGAEVMSASSAAQAVEAFRISRPDVLVSDIGMPDQDGYALIAQVRALDAQNAAGAPSPRVAAIALTALARAEDRRRAILAGFQVHLSKPIEPAELVAAVANLATAPRSAPTADDAAMSSTPASKA